ncbi:hypothetical protein TUMEXPCC7403_13420 [Tumidithrix helvetica PCC 7403]|uniref:hypothetical protein n=1 Tax=Tumidithrix helvetica TaxID=3457545 RepID=UPI003CAF6AF9
MQGQKGASWFGLIGLVAAISMAAAPVSLAQSESIALSHNFRPDPIKLGGSTGGNVSLASLAGIDANCRGFAQTQPNHVITLNESFPLLDFLVYTGGINNDPTMLIKGPGGIVVCADDESQGRNPQISRRLLPGTYQVWVGSKDANQSFRYTLSLSEIRQR